MTTKPVKPTITDPDMMPEATAVIEDKKSMMTTMYENRFVVIIIILIIVLIGVIAYVMLAPSKKPGPQQSPGAPQETQQPPQVDPATQQPPATGAQQQPPVQTSTQQQPVQPTQQNFVPQQPAQTHVYSQTKPAPQTQPVAPTTPKKPNTFSEISSFLGQETSAKQPAKQQPAQQQPAQQQPVQQPPVKPSVSQNALMHTEEEIDAKFDPSTKYQEDAFDKEFIESSETIMPPKSTSAKPINSGPTTHISTCCVQLEDSSYCKNSTNNGAYCMLHAIED
jgi:flagellar basal body-associated protein FliL